MSQEGTAIKAIVFDLGNVLFDIDFEIVYRYWAHYSNQSVKKIKQRLGLWHKSEMALQFERGLVEEDVFRQWISKKIGYNLSPDLYRESWNSLYLPCHEGMSPLLAALQANYRIVGLSNTNYTHQQSWEVLYKPQLTYFEKVFCSHELQEVKPDRAIYLPVIDYLGLPSAACVFLDDKLENVEGAKAVGMQSFQVLSFEQMKEDLTSLL